MCPCCGLKQIKTHAETKLNEVRELFGSPMIINSAYRCEAHNKAVGGVKNSQHRQGTAFDIRITQYTPEQVTRLTTLLNNAGASIGLYDTFIHADWREGPQAYWDERT